MKCEICCGETELDVPIAPKCSRSIEGFGSMRGELECYRTGYERLFAENEVFRVTANLVPGLTIDLKQAGNAAEDARKAVRDMMRRARCDVGHETEALDRIYEIGYAATGQPVTVPTMSEWKNT